MRTIKFRAKSDRGYWVYGDLVRDALHNEVYQIFADFNDSDVMINHDVIQNTISQFTGLADKNGKEIYEGDIIVVKGQYPRIVLWDKVSWALMPVELYHDKYFWEMNLQHPDKKWYEDFAEEIEVIGNIHDNKIKGRMNAEECKHLGHYYETKYCIKQSSSTKYGFKLKPCVLCYTTKPECPLFEKQ